jgi:hypothetical protein
MALAMPPLVIDFAWSRFNLALVKNSGYVGVIRYLSHDLSKSISADEVAQIQTAGLALGLIFEDGAQRALQGHDAGVADGQYANAMADRVGFPRWKPLGYAVDFQVTAAQLPTVLAYIQGAASTGRVAFGYGSTMLVDYLTTAGIGDDWQTCAWSNGFVNNKAALYQRLKPTTTLTGSFDEDVVLHPSNDLWYPGEQAPAPVVTPVSNPAPAPLIQGAPDMRVIRNTDNGRCYLAGVGTVQWLETVPQLNTWLRLCGQTSPEPVTTVDLADFAHTNPREEAA